MTRADRLHFYLALTGFNGLFCVYAVVPGMWTDSGNSREIKPDDSPLSQWIVGRQHLTFVVKETFRVESFWVREDFWVVVKSQYVCKHLGQQRNEK